MIYCYHCLYPCSSNYYYHHCLYYYVLLLLYFIVIIVIIIIVLSIINVILFYLVLFPIYFLLCVACDMYGSCRIFFPFLVNDLRIILALLIHVRNHFSFAIIVYIIIVFITVILFFQHYQSLGENSANEFEQHGLPSPIDYFG